ncbi:MAG: glycosyltransferase family 4 protein [Planctomycetaceae bacterium]
MKLLFLASGDRVPSCRFRVLQLVRPLQAAGHRCDVAHSFPQKYEHFRWLGFRPSQRLKRIVRHLQLLCARGRRYDAVILERELFHDPTWDMEQRFRKIARTFVLDVDDAVFQNFPDKFPHLVRMADLVFAGNSNLRAWLEPFGRPTVLMPTCVDVARYHPRESATADRRRPIVGWIGTEGGLKYLCEAAEGIRAAAKRHDFELRIIAGGRGVPDKVDLEGVPVRFVPWNAAAEPQEIADLDVGLMPLFDDEWSKYKCGFKLLQYMACGVPGIASPVGVNSEIIEQGRNGLLAKSPDDWESALDRLLTDPLLRLQFGTAARQTVIERYSVAANLPAWIAAVGAACGRAS